MDKNTHSNTKKINELKEMILNTPAAMAGVYAATKTLPKLIKGLNSKKAYEVYKNIGFKTFKTYTDSKGDKSNFTTLGINDVNTIANKSINKSSAASKYEMNGAQKNISKSNISIEKNTDSYGKETYLSNANEINNDSLSYLEMPPDLKEAYTELLDDVYNKYNQERLTQFGEMSSEGLDYVLKESITGYGREIAMEDMENSQDIKKDMLDNKDSDYENITASNNYESNYKDQQSRGYIPPKNLNSTEKGNYDDIYKSTQRRKVVPTAANYNSPYKDNQGRGHIPSNHLNPTNINRGFETNANYLNTFDSVSKHLKEEEELIARTDENKEFIEETSQKKIVEKRLNFEELLNKNSLEDMKSVAEEISSDLEEISQDTYIEGESTENYYESSRTQVEFNSFNIDATMNPQAYDDYGSLLNSKTTQYDVIPLGKTSEVIFRIEPSGEIFKHFNLGNKSSKEQFISKEEYLRLKEQSKSFVNEVSMEKTKSKYKEEHMSL